MRVAATCGTSLLKYCYCVHLPPNFFALFKGNIILFLIGAMDGGSWDLVASMCGSSIKFIGYSEAVTVKGISGVSFKSTHWRHMQLWMYLQYKCIQECTCKRHAIGIAPTNKMQLEYLYKTDAIGIAWGFCYVCYFYIFCIQMTWYVPTHCDPMSWIQSKIVGRHAILNKNHRQTHRSVIIWIRENCFILEGWDLQHIWVKKIACQRDVMWRCN